jgi:hypothetical protein
MSCNDKICSTRRDLMKLGLGGLTWGAFGFSLPNFLFMKEATASVATDPTIQRYDAMIQIFFRGGPSQSDTWDVPKGSKNQVFNTIDTGAKDVYNNPMYISEVFPGIASLLNDPAFGLGVVRSLNHGNGDHGTAEEMMNCWWGVPALATQYPSTAAAMAYYFQGTGLGIPSVVISGGEGDNANDAKGSTCPTALNVQVGQGQGANPTVQELSMPTGVTAARYALRQRLQQDVNQNFLATRPDLTVKAYDKAWNDAYNITVQGVAAKAFDLTGKTILPGATSVAGNPANPDGGTLQSLTLAQNLITAGIPFVACGIDGNDSHTGNRQTIQDNWGATIDPAVTQMAKNLKATGKRVLITMFGEFGRTPDTTASGRDGRDHDADHVTFAMLSVNQPKFKTTAIGDTGPDGMFTVADKNLKDPMYLKDIGGMLYTAMGFLPGNSPTTDIPTAIRAAPPVDRVNNSGVLLKAFGIG